MTGLLRDTSTPDTVGDGLVDVDLLQLHWVTVTALDLGKNSRRISVHTVHRSMYAHTPYTYTHACTHTHTLHSQRTSALHLGHSPRVS
jgi:hypothetical protein